MVVRTIGLRDALNPSSDGAELVFVLRPRKVSLKPVLDCANGATKRVIQSGLDRHVDARSVALRRETSVGRSGENPMEAIYVPRTGASQEPSRWLAYHLLGRLHPLGPASAHQDIERAETVRLPIDDFEAHRVIVERQRRGEIVEVCKDLVDGRVDERAQTDCHRRER